jgi:organic radical activating enzyme
MIKTRIFPEHNYKGIWYNGKTIRIALNPNEPITELEYPEFLDVKLTEKCFGKCEYCYMSSNQQDTHYSNVISKIKNYFGILTENQKPFQVAIGGGEPTLHPDFIEVLKTFKELGIEPNYTTNGMFIEQDNKEEILKVTEELCGGVAISCHPHLDKYWIEASKEFGKYNIKLNFHIIISDKESIDRFVDIYDVWKDKIEYFVLLPYGVQGRAKHKDIDWEYLVTKLPENQSKIAFGANFYPYLLEGNHNIKVSLYEPEIMSKFLDLKDMKLYKSSFNLSE